jgi:hypothetical protein
MPQQFFFATFAAKGERIFGFVPAGSANALLRIDWIFVPKLPLLFATIACTNRRCQIAMTAEANIPPTTIRIEIPQGFFSLAALTSSHGKAPPAHAANALAAIIGISVKGLPDLVAPVAVFERCNQP